MNRYPVPRYGGPCYMAILAVLAAGLLVAGCIDNQSVEVVDFTKTLPVKRPGLDGEEQPPLKVAVAAMISPAETFNSYRKLLGFIAKRLDRKVNLVQRKTYTEVNELLGKGEIDLAFICSGPYISGKDRYGFEAVAVPEVRGHYRYRSYLIVNADSTLESLKDLQGKTFAFTDPESNTGRLVPTFWLSQRGTNPESFFDRIIYTYSHDNSIMAVAKGMVDGAAVHEQIWEYFNVRHPVHTSKTRILKKSIPFGNPPIVASSKMDKQQKTSIQRLLLSMHQSREGRKILAGLLVDRFVAPELSWYEPISSMKTKLSSLKDSNDASSKS